MALLLANRTRSCIFDGHNGQMVVGLYAKLLLSSNPQPIGFSGILLAKRQN